MQSNLPDKATRCHRTGFQETCFRCVTEHGCRLWKRVTLEFDPETGAKGTKDHYDCLDSLVDTYWKDMLRRQLQTTATVDKVAEEVGRTTHAVREGSDGQMIAAIHALRGTAPQIPQLSHNGTKPLLIEQD